MRDVDIRTEAFRLVRFSIVGGGATIVHMAVSLSLAGVFSFAAQIANLIAFLTAFCVSFLGHYFYTFKSQQAMSRVIPKFAIAAISGYAASALLLFLLRYVDIAGQIKLILAAMVVPIVSYLINRFWVF